MIKCERCGYANDRIKVPMICPECGAIAKPFKVVKKKQKDEHVEETVMLQELID